MKIRPEVLRTILTTSLHCEAKELDEAITALTGQQPHERPRVIPATKAMWYWLVQRFPAGSLDAIVSGEARDDLEIEPMTPAERTVYLNKYRGLLGVGQ